MSDSYRRNRHALIALVSALAAIVAVVALTQPPDTKIAQGSNGDVAKYEYQDVAQLVAAIRDFDPWEDTFAQWAMAILAGAATGVSLYGVRLLKQTLDANTIAANAAVAASTAADDTNKIMREDRRAWVNVQLVPYRDIERGKAGGFHSQITLALENTGSSIAFDVRAFIRPYLLDSNDPTPRQDALAWLISRMKNRHELEQGKIIFPRETISFEPDLSMRADEVDITLNLIIRVAAMVQYRTAEIDGIRETYINFDIFDSDLSGITQIATLTEGNLPPDRMRIAKTGFGHAT